MEPTAPPTVKNAQAEGCVGVVLSIGLLVVALPFAIWAFTLSAPIAGDGRLLVASLLVYAPMLVLTALVVGRGPGRMRALVYTAISALLGSAMLGSALAMLVNSGFDGEPHEHTTRVVDKSENTARGKTRHYVVLAPFAPLEAPHEIEVSRATFEHYSAAGARPEIVVYVGNGALGIPYLVQEWGTPKVRIP